MVGVGWGDVQSIPTGQGGVWSSKLFEEPTYSEPVDLDTFMVKKVTTGTETKQTD